MLLLQLRRRRGPLRPLSTPITCAIFLVVRVLQRVVIVLLGLLIIIRLVLRGLCCGRVISRGISRSGRRGAQPRDLGPQARQLGILLRKGARQPGLVLARWGRLARGRQERLFTCVCLGRRCLGSCAHGRGGLLELRAQPARLRLLRLEQRRRVLQLLHRLLAPLVGTRQLSLDGLQALRGGRGGTLGRSQGLVVRLRGIFDLVEPDGHVALLGGELDELGLQPLLLQLDLRHSEHRRLICLDRSLLGGGQGRLKLGLAAVRLLARMRERRLGRLTPDLVLGHARLRTIELISQGLELRLKLRRAAGRRHERLRWRRRLRRTRPDARCLQLRRCELPAQLAQLRRHPREHLLLLSVATAHRIDESRPRLGS